MAVIDVSQKTYRSLVKAAHERGMSIDRFIQLTLDKSENADKAELNQSVIEFATEPLQTSGSETPSHRRRATRQPKLTNDPGPAFSALWSHIEEGAGRKISTMRGQDFTYEIDAGYMTVVESGARIPQSQFKKALEQWPQNGPSNMRGIYAASIVWAVLADRKISLNAA